MSVSNHNEDTAVLAESILLKITTADEAAEIFVMDGDFKRVASARGKMETRLAPGVYKLKVSAGAQTREEYLVLESKEKIVQRHFDLIPFASPAPLISTLKTHEYHINNADTESRKTHVGIGTGSSIFIFARDWTAKTPENSPLGYQDPVRGLSLCDLAGNTLVNFSEKSVRERRADPWSACNVMVDPGIYRLRLTRPSSILEQTIVACKGWQTQVFALQRACGRDRLDKCADLAQAAVFLARPETGFVASDPGQRLSELARLGLSNRRMVLSDEQRTQILEGKFQDPMLGIYGAHLLIMSKATDLQACLREIVANLRKLLITQHPDVESLALNLEDQPSDYIFTAPPMLNRSWTLVLDASMAKPGLVPLGSLADRATDHLLGQEPWLISWEDRKEAKATQARDESAADLPDTAELVKNYLREISLPRRVKRQAAPQSFPRRLISHFLPRESAVEALAERWWPEKIDQTELKHLVKTLRIPRARLESILNELTTTAKKEEPSLVRSADSG